MERPQDIINMPIENVVSRIQTLTIGLEVFWSRADGWAPIEAAQLLSRSRLDWQVSIAACLPLFLRPSSEPSSTGRLILGWATLGCLVEGTLKLFLSVYFEPYKRHFEELWRHSTPREPGLLTLERLRQFFERHVWRTEPTWISWIAHIQQRRNVIHAFADRDLGTHEEFLQDVRTYLVFMRVINQRLPYPDDCYRPTEI